MPISLNVPVPGQVKRLAGDLEPALYTFDRVRRTHTLGVKRLGEHTPAEYARLVPAVRRAIAGTPPFEARVTGIETFERPTHGDLPVVYLAVESPALHALNERLCETFEPIEGIDGEGYVPHVTLAHGGTAAERERLREWAIEPVTWTVNELVLWDATYKEVATRFSLPV
ncbi:2'-5' RNA ligase family protein [Halalkalicoccus sp. NIPERK01]|uniref:2'-5' RNA ligase family protein n=1 Tax=Halalkalicoccus sp. NIPERK01 TaxID=3053469 RepID=UPI00256F4810|nr:2'-5' RNA ligase family protein [Halalkalicoccus sp. NIPERK01]